MNKYIVTCKCSGVAEKAKAAFAILYPRRETPEVFGGEDRIRYLAESYPGTDFGRYLMAIAKKNGQYAYYMEEEDGGVVMNYDLLKGKRIG